MFKEVFLLANGYPHIPKSVTAAIHLARTGRATLTAIFIIDSNWESILGDEWISSRQTRLDFRRYFEREMKREAGEALEEIMDKGSGNGVRVKTRLLEGQPEKTIVSTCSPAGTEGVLILPRIPVRTPGTVPIRPARFLKETSCRLLTVPESKKHQHK